MGTSTSDRYSSAYTEEGFWNTLARFASRAGQEVVEKALLLFYAAQREQAPAWAKATIAGALGYFILPTDLVADLIPAVGYSDDLGVLALAIAAVATYINDDVREHTATRMRALFGDSVLDDRRADRPQD
ncbi:MAG: DUF1232 domain-containing protein [Pseudomonadota bacterium]